MTPDLRWEHPLHRLPRITLWLLLLGIVAAVIWAALTPVRMYALVPGTLAPLTPPVQINAPSAGRVTTSQVRIWQRVKRGQVLLTIDAAARDPQDAALQLNVQRTAAVQARQDIELATLQLREKERTLTSIQEVYALGGLPRADLDAAQAAVEAGRGAVTQARARLSAAESQLTLLTRSQQVRVVSPVDGQIMTLSDVNAGYTVGAGQTILTILPAEVPLVFSGVALERDRPKLQPGADARVAWNSYPRQKYGVTNGVLQGVAPTSQATANGQVSYDVRIEVKPEDGMTVKGKPLVPGMVGQAQVLSGSRTVLQLFFDWVRGIDPWN